MVGTGTLWVLIARLARGTHWRAIDQTVGDGMLASGLTLGPPLGTSVTRPAGRPEFRLPPDAEGGESGR